MFGKLFFIGLLFYTLNTSAQVQIGQAYPDIRLPDSLGKWTTLSDLKADYILLDFWAAWCPPCVVAMQELKKIKEENKNASFEIYALSLDRDYWNWVNTVRKLDLPFIHVNDAYGLKSPRCTAYGVTSIPSKFLIHKGKIIAINPTFEEIRKAIKNG